MENQKADFIKRITSVESVLNKFVTFDSRFSPRSGSIVKCEHDTWVMLFSDGTWTVTNQVGLHGVAMGKWRHSVRMYIRALETLGAITSDEVAAYFAYWESESKRIEKEKTEEYLRREATKIGYRLEPIDE